MLQQASNPPSKDTSNSPRWFPKRLFDKQNYNTLPTLSDVSSSSSSSISEDDIQPPLLCGDNWLLTMGRSLDVDDFISLDDRKHDESAIKLSPKHERKIKTKPISRSFLHKKSLLKQDENTILSEPCKHINFLTNESVGGSKIACPFCRRYLFNRAALLKDKLPRKRSSVRNSLVESMGEELLSVDELMTRGTVTSVLLDGWIMKQGDNWLGHKTWKPRFAKLTLMKLPKYRAEVPVLHTYWYEISMTPSSSFILDSATLELSREDFCFDVQVNTVRRRFAAPEDQVEEWIYAITLAIASYKQLQRRILPVSNSPRRRRLSLMDEMNWEPGNFLFKDTYI